MRTRALSPSAAPALSACSDEPAAAPASKAAAPELEGRCPVTPPSGEPVEDFDYGDRPLAATIRPREAARRRAPGRLGLGEIRPARPAGYGPSGFQPTVLTFPTAGCRRVAGRVGDARLS